jgi:hypothetical protein
VKRSVLTIFVATKDEKRLKLPLAIYLDLFSELGALFRDLGYILSHFGSFSPFIRLQKKL